MCTEITHADLVTVHHEMGHIVYFMEYRDQPFIYRDSANPGKRTLVLDSLRLIWSDGQILFHVGFHEAIGDTMALAVNTPAHLEGLGLLNRTDSERDTEQENLAYLFHVALQKVSLS